MSDVPMLPHGLWPSPVDAAVLAKALRFDDLGWSASGALLWLEYRGNHGAVLAAPENGEAHVDLTGPAYNVRARVGYGGGSMAVGGNALLFVERKGQLYRQPLTQGPARAIIPPHGFCASPALSPDGAWLVYVHHDGRDDCLAACDSKGTGWPARLVGGADFYLDPVWHPSGKRIAWIEWDHPRMPWDGTRLMLAQVKPHGDQQGDRLSLKHREQIAGNAETSITQPRFSPDGKTLAYISDENGWPNLYLYDLERQRSRCLVATDAELGPPAWVQGVRTHGFAADGASIFVIENRRGFQRLLRTSTSTGSANAVLGLEEYTELRSITPAPRGDKLALIASAPQISSRVLLWEKDQTRVVRRATGERVSANALSVPEPVQWSAPSGEEVHALLYRPHSLTHRCGALPPAIVAIHGGPTAQALASYNPRAQFFATRGYAYLELNYRGSSGYGRAYQRALDRQWGVLDVEDALGAHRHLREGGIADGRRIAIMGGSAGGYTVLKTLTDHPGVFAAGLSLYGVSNLFTLASDTHKFEAHYLDSLLGPLPEAADIYRERSPIFFADRISDPVAIFQGSDDRVVPPDQAEQIVASLRQRGVPHEYHLYEGEEHGFRRPDTLKRFYRDVECFLRQHLIYC